MEPVRVCKTCDQAYPANDTHFPRNYGGYLLWKCRACTNISKRPLWKARYWRDPERFRQDSKLNYQYRKGKKKAGV